MYASELLQLGQLVRQIWPERPPALLAPDSNFDAEWFGEFLRILFPNATRADESSADVVGAAGSEKPPLQGLAQPPSIPPQLLPLNFVSHHMCVSFTCALHATYEYRVSILAPRCCLACRSLQLEPCNKGQRATRAH